MALFDLAVHGVDAFYQRRPGAKRLVRREPLSGLADGSNKVFLSPHHPFLYSTFAAYLYGVQQSAGSFSAIDADGGVVQFNTAPLVQPVADYTAVPHTNRQVIYYCWAGYQLMEHLWQRGFLVSSSDSAYAQADYEDDHAYIVAGQSVTDPACGGLTFSTSQVQIGFLSRCIEMAYLDSLAYESAAADIDWRERAGGIAVNSSSRPRNLLAMKEAVWKDLVRAWYGAMDEYYTSGEQYASKVTVPHTDEYNDIWHWQADADGIIIPRWIRW